MNIVFRAKKYIRIPEGFVSYRIQCSYCKLTWDSIDSNCHTCNGTKYDMFNANESGDLANGWNHSQFSWKRYYKIY